MAEDITGRYRLADTANPDAGFEYLGGHGRWEPIATADVPSWVLARFGRTRTRAQVAMDLEDAAARIIESMTDGVGAPHKVDDAVAIAHVMATLALGQRVAALTDTLVDLGRPV